MKKLLLTLPIAALLLVGAGCAPEDVCPDEYQKYGSCFVEEDVRACIDSGGVPIIRAGGNHLKDCKFNQ